MSFLDSLMAAEREQARERRVFGIVSAIVRRILDDGTYEVSYLSMASDEPSSPARVMMPMCGRGRGTYFMPEVGDEVIVAFESGDLNQPVILGAVWNERDQPPTQATPSTDNHVRTIVSRSGHELTFDDSPGREKITLKTKGGRALVLDDTPPGKVSVSTPMGNSLELEDGTGTLKLSAAIKIEFSAPSLSFSTTQLSITAPAGVQVTTTGVVTASTFVIDGVPFGLHVHRPPVVLPTASTGPVSPL